MAEVPSKSVSRAQFGSPGLAIGLLVLYAALLMLPLVIAGMAGTRGPEAFARVAAKNFALVATTILFMQAVLAARIKQICRHYGLDMVLRFHKAMAVLAVTLLIAHPVLLSLGSGSWRLLTSLDMPWPIWFGRTALVLLLIQGITSLWQRQLLDFQVWRKLHNIAPVILVLGFVHSWIVGDELESPMMRVLWVVLMGASVTAYTLHKFVWPMTRKSKLWTVVSVKPETHSVWTLEFEPPEGVEPLQHAPGQFNFLTLYRGDERYDGEEHHFTISSSPLQGQTHTSTIKSSGDFTSTIGATKPGDQVAIQGPYGSFSYVLDRPSSKYLFIAGGIGITPLMAMLRHMRDTAADVDVTLIHANNTQDDIVFRDELDEMVDGDAPRL
ncbi:MAG TPA: oxidoreductase, partial [Armatimonadetes bacterium]|nr:oxidoreductase [Armatimonadota bacterium]